MCPSRDAFSTYESLNSGSVLLGNNVECKAIGKGSIQIKVHDGKVQTLTDVHHILELKKSLISLGVLDSAGYQFAAQGGVMEVSKDSQIMMIGKNVNNLYILQGNTVPGPAYESPLRESKSSTTQHMCLQHTNEKDIGVWSKQHTSRSHLNSHHDFVRQSRVRFSTAVCGIEGRTVTDLQGS